MESTPQVAPTVPAVSSPAPDQASPQSPDSAPSEGAQQDTSAQQEDRRHRSAKARIDQITASYREQERRAHEAEAKLAALERQQASSKQFAEIDAKQPRMDQFGDLHSYSLAMAEWNRARTLAEAEQRWSERDQQRTIREAQELAQAYEQQQRAVHENARLEEKMSQGAKKYPDFNAALTNPELPSVRGTPLFALVMEADNAPDIAYSLAKNPAELDRLLSIRNAAALAREVFRLDQKFTGNGATQAPPPPPQRTGSGTASKDWGSMSTREHVEAYRRQKSKR